jgi:hypothetical protein
LQASRDCRNQTRQPGDGLPSERWAKGTTTDRNFAIPLENSENLGPAGILFQEAGKRQIRLRQICDRTQITHINQTPNRHTRSSGGDDTRQPKHDRRLARTWAAELQRDMRNAIPRASFYFLASRLVVH